MTLQITPLLGILHDIWERRQRVRGGSGRYCRPGHVLLVWAVRNPQEVVLLGQGLMDAAR